MCDGQQKTSRTAVHREGVAHSKPGSRAGPASAECCSPKVQHIPLSCRVSRADIHAHDQPLSDSTCALSARCLNAQCTALRAEGFVPIYRALTWARLRRARPPCTSTEVASGSREGKLYFTVCIYNIDTKWT